MLKCKMCPASIEPGALTIRIAVTPGSLSDYARLCSWTCSVRYCEEQILQQEREDHANDLAAAIKHQRRVYRRVK